MNRLEAAITTWLPEEGLFKDLHKYPQVSITEHQFFQYAFVFLSNDLAYKAELLFLDYLV